MLTDSTPLSPTTSPTPSAGGSGGSSSGNNGNGLSGGAIAGIVIGSVAVAIAICFAAWYFCGDKDLMQRGSAERKMSNCKISYLYGIYSLLLHSVGDGR